MNIILETMRECEGFKPQAMFGRTEHTKNTLINRGYYAEASAYWSFVCLGHPEMPREIVELQAQFDKDITSPPNMDTWGT